MVLLPDSGYLPSTHENTIRIYNIRIIHIYNIRIIQYYTYIQYTKTSTALQTKRTKEQRTTEEEMGGPTSPGGLRNRQHA